ncbi:MAG: Lrp/AsnC family transcriptional regulator [archaeon]
MNKTDEKLIAELDKNPRIAISRLARKLRISQQVADYRLKKLQKQEVISKLGAIINLKSLGLEHYRVFFSFNSRKEYSDEKIFSYLKNKKGVYWGARIGGRYDLHLALLVKDFQELDEFIDDFNSSFPGLIKDYTSCYSIEHIIFRHKYLSKDYSEISYGYNDRLKKTDKLDREILEKLKDNCRISSLELAKGKNISYKTIINRIKSLEKNKIILGYRLFIKSQEKKPFIILFSFKDYSKKEEKNLISYLSRTDSTTQLIRLFGSWNLFIHARIEDNEKLQKLIIDLRDKFEIIDNFEIIPVFEDIAINLFPE